MLRTQPAERWGAQVALLQSPILPSAVFSFNLSPTPVYRAGTLFHFCSDEVSGFELAPTGFFSGVKALLIVLGALAVYRGKTTRSSPGRRWQSSRS